MTASQKKVYNFQNEDNYHFAPFTEQRRELRKVWSISRKSWDSFLYDQENKHQSKIKQNEA